MTEQPTVQRISSAQQFVLNTDTHGRVQVDLNDLIDGEGVRWVLIDTAVAHLNSPNGRVDWTQVTGDTELTFKCSRTLDGRSEPLPDAQITVTLQVWGDITEPEG